MTKNQRIILEKHIGSVGSGNVYKGIWKSFIAAIKLITYPDNMEVEIHKKLRFRNIILFYDIVSFIDSIAIITEYAEKGSLRSILANNNIEITWPERWRYVEEIIHGI